MTQKQILLNYLEKMRRDNPLEGWVRAYHLRGKHTDYGFAGHQADRRLRELAKSGLIEHRINEKYAEYRAKEEPRLRPISNYKPSQMSRLI